jgi:A/G-specific adenine glycosylase
VSSSCAWRAADRPLWDGPPRRGQSYTGTDRQCRGALLAVLRSSDDPVAADELASAWRSDDQRARALDSLVADGLVVAVADRWSLPG